MMPPTQVALWTTRTAASALRLVRAATATLLETDDPRLSGEFETNSNYDVYSSGATASTFIGRLTNDGGSWAIVGQGLNLGGGLNHYVDHYTGEDGYEGLSAMLLQRPAPGGWEVEGVIIPGAWPEPPEWVLPPAE